MAIEVYKTNIEDHKEAAAIAVSLLKEFPYLKITFDLDDCDRVMRVIGTFIPCNRIQNLLEESGYECNVLE